MAGRINLGPLKHTGQEYRAEVRHAAGRQWALLSLWLNGCHAEDLVVDSTRRVPADDEPDRVWESYTADLIRLAERRLAAYFLAWRPKAEAPRPPVPLVKRLLREVLRWVEES